MWHPTSDILPFALIDSIHDFLSIKAGPTAAMAERFPEENTGPDRLRGRGTVSES